jgi:translation elongation factor EF-G
MLLSSCVSFTAGVQPLLDGVSDYLPCPTDVQNIALDIDDEEKELTLPCRCAAAAAASQNRMIRCFDPAATRQ